MKTVTFSNGHTATYKGRRGVKVAWMVITPNNKILTGFSLDMEKAIKTSRNNASILCPNNNLLGFGGRGPFPISVLKAREKEAKKRGFKNFQEWEQHTKDETKKWLEECHFEYKEV